MFSFRTIENKSLSSDNLIEEKAILIQSFYVSIYIIYNSTSQTIMPMYKEVQRLDITGGQ